MWESEGGEPKSDSRLERGDQESSLEKVNSEGTAQKLATRRMNSEDGGEEEVSQKEDNRFNVLSSRGQRKPGKFWELKEVRPSCLEGSE